MVSLSAALVNSVLIILVSHQFGRSVFEEARIRSAAFGSFWALSYILVSMPAVFLTFLGFYGIIAVNFGWEPLESGNEFEAAFTIFSEALRGEGRLATYALISQCFLLTASPMFLSLAKYAFVDKRDVDRQQIVQKSLGRAKKILVFVLGLNWRGFLIVLISLLEDFLGMLAVISAFAWWLRPDVNYEPTIVLLTVLLVFLDLMRKGLKAG